MMVTPELIRALIASNEHMLWVLSSPPPDPNERERWEGHRLRLEQQTKRFRIELQKALAKEKAPVERGASGRVLGAKRA